MIGAEGVNFMHWINKLQLSGTDFILNIRDFVQTVEQDTSFTVGNVSQRWVIEYISIHLFICRFFDLSTKKPEWNIVKKNTSDKHVT